MGSRVAITGAFSYSGFWGWWKRRGSVFFAEIQVAFGGGVLGKQCNVVDAYYETIVIRFLDTVEYVDC